MPNHSTTFVTNATPGSVLKVQKKKLLFSELWSRYPKHAIEHIDPRSKKDIFDNHCAINLSQALYECGVLLKAFRGTRCWSCPNANSDGQGIHAVKAQDLADYLGKRPFAGCPAAKRLSASGGFPENVRGETGIVFFKDYWQRTGETGRTGDHIDLWNGKALASIGFLLTWVRSTFPAFSESHLEMSDLQKSQSILFWDIS